MYRIYQTKFGPRVGNCVQAAWASLLERPLETIPDFSAVSRPSAVTQRAAEAAFARANGLELIHMGPNLPAGMEDIVHFGTGRSPRGLMHRVVMLGNRIIHDPHPEGGGVQLRGRTFVVPL